LLAGRGRFNEADERTTFKIAVAKLYNNLLYFFPYQIIPCPVISCDFIYMLKTTFLAFLVHAFNSLSHKFFNFRSNLSEIFFGLLWISLHLTRPRGVRVENDLQFRQPVEVKSMNDLIFKVPH
jgi:hypothetical protein